jgi:hypothetical protein
MSTQSLGNEVQEKLTQALESGRMPAGVEVRAKQLLARLCQPVRLGVLGRFGSGKSSLVNLLVGFEVLPYDVRLPTTQVTFAEKASAVCTLADGTKREIATASAYDITELKPLFVELRLPLPALRKFRFLKLSHRIIPTQFTRQANGLPSAVNWLFGVPKPLMSTNRKFGAKCPISSKTTRS